MIQLENIRKSYDAMPALEKISLDIAQGQTTVLIGPSGCGKSTLLRIMIGLISPDEGRVHFLGEPLTSINILSARLKMGYVIQEGGLFPHLTAYENVALLAKHLGWSLRKISDRVDQLSGLTKITSDVLSRYPVQISGGQRQRVSLMRALMLDPEVLLLDEPLGALDPLIRFDLQNDLKEIFQSLRKTVVMVTHDIAEAAFFGNRILLLKDGRIVQEGLLRDMIDNPAEAFVEQFIKSQRTF